MVSRLEVCVLVALQCFYNQNVPISTLRFMGRWTVEKSLEHYIQLAMATQILNKLDQSVVSRLSKLAPLCLSCVFEDSKLLENLGPLPGKKSSPAGDRGLV